MKEHAPITALEILQSRGELLSLEVFLVGTGILAHPDRFVRWDDPVTGDSVFYKREACAR